mmetsp:Transcript_2459/g.5719  ORF Transcript_2459/g.5719 Transcript_2459/m.5719 type:complete len:124 (-) Transcript_2459:12-383(-)
MNFLIRGILNFQSTIKTPSSKDLYHQMLTICRIHAPDTINDHTDATNNVDDGNPKPLSFHLAWNQRRTRTSLRRLSPRLASHLISSHPPLVHLGHREDRDIMGFILVGFNSYVYVPTLVFRVS